MHKNNALDDRLSLEVDSARDQEQETYRTMRDVVPGLGAGPVTEADMTPEMLLAVSAHKSAYDHRRALERERRALTEVALRLLD